MRVVRAHKQVVSGMNYFLDVQLGRTTCTKSQANLRQLSFPWPAAPEEGKAVLLPGLCRPMDEHHQHGEV